ncbi:hypothetical protein [Nocardioides sp. SYSU D00038]|uniref:hypothetical protein n=1 Tax=Nocardioides sp. SYSU D00038 TaxID=2812554 RepID=UPI0019685F03|nr:hypothetical protein [Nocardioides sp. SYSU D00038]
MIATRTPFAWGEADAEQELGPPLRRQVIQCALSRICGVCAESLGRPIAFLGTPEEAARNAFHCPPMHVTCAEDLRRHAGADPRWGITTTSGFELVRPGRDDADPDVRFEPNSLLQDP